MASEAGPGPSSSMSSPVVPTSAKKLRLKKRVVNLVNPAGPEDFSSETMSIDISPAKSTPEKERLPTPPPMTQRISDLIKTSTPGENGVKGILRPSGTPGSGNGVRFFPKNKFRIITPNQSIHDPAPAAPSPSSNSFLSQLLAVSFHTKVAAPPSREPPAPKADESWEVPGQEGEISLIANSTGSEFHDGESQQEEEQEAEEEPWSGVPTVISSPLSLPSSEPEPTNASYSELELPSADWQLPDDMSNLLSQRFEMSSQSSFSVRDEMPRPENTQTIHAGNQSAGMWSEDGLEDGDSNPTIRRQLSPLPPTMETRSLLLSPSPSAAVTDVLATPTPAKAFTSIFADLSAEHADMSWPVLRKSNSSPQADSTVFHSMVMERSFDGESGTPKSNSTQFFECDTTSLIFSASTPQDLLAPTRSLFDAQQSHTKAMEAELRLYKALAEKLQSEVVERDSVLAELNLRLVESEMMGNKRRESHAHAHAGDRTTRDEGEIRDLEIRLKKMAGELEAYRKVEAENERLVKEVESLREEKAEREIATRDAEVKEARKGEEMAAELQHTRRRIEELETLESQQPSGEPDHAHRRIEVLENEVESLRAQHMDELDTMHRQMDELECQIEELRSASINDNEEIVRLGGVVERQEAESAARITELDSAFDNEQTKGHELHRRLEEEIGTRRKAESETKRLLHDLEEAQSQIRELVDRVLHLEHDLREASTLEDEIARLKTESASKDFEILNLQKRKAELKEDREMLNVALDSKQQELELIKRKFSVKGVAGCTPLPLGSSTTKMNTPYTPAPGHQLHTTRRSSMALVTPGMGKDPAKRGVMLHASTQKIQRTIGDGKGSVRRERMLA
ncbi:hypothetical protein P7C73_g48, partial [Tremellales sp. Uapishka_1]